MQLPSGAFQGAATSLLWCSCPVYRDPEDINTALGRYIDSTSRSPSYFTWSWNKYHQWANIQRVKQAKITDFWFPPDPMKIPILQYFEYWWRSIYVTSPTVKDKAMREKTSCSAKKDCRKLSFWLLLKLEEVTNIFNLLDCEILSTLHYSQFLIYCLRARTRSRWFCSAGGGAMVRESQATWGQSLAQIR